MSSMNSTLSSDRGVLGLLRAELACTNGVEAQTSVVRRFEPTRGFGWDGVRVEEGVVSSTNSGSSSDGVSLRIGVDELVWAA